MLKKLSELSESGYYWSFLFVLGIALEGTALFYQYVLNYYPCVLCIHVRVWVLGMIVVSGLALWLRRQRVALLAANVLMTVMLVGLSERAYMLLGVERGFIFGQCNFDSGLPAWFALDKWFPLVFKVLDSCGYTPKLLFGITMAEALIVMAPLLLLLSVAMTVSVLREKFFSTR